MIDALFINDVPIECITQAAAAYHVPAKLIISVLLTEGGKVGSASLNKNGTHDYGPMQINTIWLPKLRQFNITREDIQYNPCTNVWVGTWILCQRIADSKDLAYGIGSYNSYSPPQNQRYRTKVTGMHDSLSYVLSLPEEQFQKAMADLKLQREAQRAAREARKSSKNKQWIIATPNMVTE
jgi:hypothetical protein